MTRTRTTILAALVAALGITTAFGSAYAAGPADQQRPGPGPQRPGFDQRGGAPMMDFRRDGMGGAFSLADVTCAPRAAERLETRLDRVTDRLDLTDEQQKLFEEFRASALTAQTGFADTCATMTPASADAGTDLIQRLEQRLKFDEARLEAMTELLPPLKSFYESLTDEQKADLMPGRMREGMNMPGGRFEHHRHGGPAEPGRM
jgi:hypothetical protein